MTDYQKGNCDRCGNYSTKLLANHDQYGCLEGWFCRKCEREIEQSIAEAYSDKAFMKYYTGELRKKWKGMTIGQILGFRKNRPRAY